MTERTDMARSTTDAVAVLLVETLGLTGEAAVLHEDSPLLGGMSEFDSLAVVEVVVAVQDRFGIEIDDDDLTADVFATVRSLCEFVDDRI